MENTNTNCCGSQWKEKNDVFKVLTFFLLITTIFMVFKTITAYKESAFVGLEGQSTITFTGKGEVFAIADVATFNFSVVEISSTVAKAQEDSAKKINAIMGYLKEQGIEEKDIKTANYNVYPKYEWRRDTVCEGGFCSDGKNVLVGYEASQTITVKVRDTEKSGTLLTGVGELGASNISGLTFSVDDEEASKREARKLAIEDAQNKAKELAKDLDVKLVRIVSFNESGDFPVYAYDKEVSMGMGGAEAVPPQIPVGENQIISNVSITYQIK
ncbi:TPA: hypothetical protein DCZ46_01835 [Candidatus Campbellbacteria bacterium]|nr:MAG: hypothetical protein UR58_C0001G0333 [Candidatus Campbellbacteria bacterium GW2011_OD1_34_28]KKP75180.1 MAG: hypothetical protein UR74_C0001G0036 [Candidatus Campbellbacteria bacterium GW2011_GWD2_35_24]KKP76259.1 MAG: hypothetical protein UR75_C0001G0293 [Candidatus Campbellbacteria bacterium GW2011_GWC2_35_28]KKP77448.1 MAG: hypothetical protein UR76_C0001G0293 [Candidatus Campbellbacteria bacterium GW2011_GWC1_35_31]KKP79377.1 MAG: hypothetical protein UR79_C0001G0293 [Candidatus Cam